MIFQVYLDIVGNYIIDELLKARTELALSDMLQGSSYFGYYKHFNREAQFRSQKEFTYNTVRPCWASMEKKMTELLSVFQSHSRPLHNNNSYSLLASR